MFTSVPLGKTKFLPEAVICASTAALFVLKSNLLNSPLPYNIYLYAIRPLSIKAEPRMRMKPVFVTTIFELISDIFSSDKYIQ